MILEIAAALVVGGATAGLFYERRHAALHVQANESIAVGLNGALERIENAADAIHDHMVEMHDTVVSSVDRVLDHVDDLHGKVDAVAAQVAPGPVPKPASSKA